MMLINMIKKFNGKTEGNWLLRHLVMEYDIVIRSRVQPVKNQKQLKAMIAVMCAWWPL